MRAGSNCRFAVWVISFVLTIAVFQLLASMHARSAPWIAVSLVAAGVIGAGLLSLADWLCGRFVRK